MECKEEEEADHGYQSPCSQNAVSLKPLFHPPSSINLTAKKCKEDDPAYLLDKCGHCSENARQKVPFQSA